MHDAQCIVDDAGVNGACGENHAGDYLNNKTCELASARAIADLLNARCTMLTEEFLSFGTIITYLLRRTIITYPSERLLLAQSTGLRSANLETIDEVLPSQCTIGHAGGTLCRWQSSAPAARLMQ